MIPNLKFNKEQISRYLPWLGVDRESHKATKTGEILAQVRLLEGASLQYQTLHVKQELYHYGWGGDGKFRTGTWRSHHELDDYTRR